MSGIVIVGAGQGAFQLGSSLRQNGFRDAITIVGDEAVVPYGRPALSKAYLSGKAEAAGLHLRPAAFYAEHGIALRVGERVRSIARADRTVELGSGERLGYDHLVLATGSRNRILAVPGACLPGVHALRTLSEADALRAALEQARSVVIVGAGFIGLEFAAACASRGIAVTVMEGASRVLARSTSPAMAETIEASHRASGVGFVFGAAVVAIEGRDRVGGVATADGRIHAADLVLVGIGVVPNQDLAAASGLAVSDGIEVDERLLTSDPAISAIGDCARHPSPHADGGRVRIESVQSAVDGARCVAARLTGTPQAHVAVPWFWSDQGTLRLQIAGLSHGADRDVLRGDPATGAFSVFRFRGVQLVGVESLNRASDHMVSRRLIERGLSPSPERCADPAADLKSLVA